MTWFIFLHNERNFVFAGKYVLPTGTKVIIPIAMVHRRPDFWPDPAKFDPDRFSPETSKSRHPFRFLPDEVEKRPVCSYIPFSYGARNCIGNVGNLMFNL